MTYVFCPLQRRQASESFGGGAEEEHHPPIGEVAVGWRCTRFGQEQCQCDRIVGQSSVTHGGACALGGIGGHGH